MQEGALITNKQSASQHDLSECNVVLYKLELMIFQGWWKASTILCSQEQRSDGMSSCTVWCSSITHNIKIIAAMIARVSTAAADTAAGSTVGNVVYVDATDLPMLYASSKVCKKIIL